MQRPNESILSEAQKIVQGYVAGVARSTDAYTAALAQRRCQEFLTDLRERLTAKPVSEKDRPEGAPVTQPGPKEA